MKKLREQLLGFIREHKSSRLAIASHRNFDLDALCSCYALKSALPESVLVCPDKMDAPAKAFAEKMGMEFSELSKLDKKDFGGMVIVDCATPVLLPDAKGWDIKLIVDHHHPSQNPLEAELRLIDEDAPSTAEMLAEMLPSLSAEIAFVLGVAVVSDTARFKSARASTFRVLASLMEKAGRDYKEMLADAEPELEAEEKLVVLEAFKKMRLHVHGGFVVATSIVSAHESLVSSSMSEFADVAFVAKWKAEENESRVSSRARKGVPVRMNEVMAEVAAQLGGGGGGHPKAAGCSSKERPEATLDKCVEVFISYMDKTL